ncbi:unnamed protein product, partial [Mesorhabditis spiculigera]
MTCPEESYTSVLVTRYCRSSPLLKTFSEKNKTILWRQLWIWLAEAELELGLKQITQEAVDELKANRDNIDWPLLRAEERRLKHDVMAHNHTYGKAANRHDAFFVVFLSNEERAFSIFEQKACREDRDYVIWDYHVILVEKVDGASKVYDLDTRLDFPCPFTEYCEESFPSEWKFPPECARKFRILPVAVYLEHFSSDRRHMRKADNTWNSPPPSWEPNFRVELGEL